MARLEHVSSGLETELPRSSVVGCDAAARPRLHAASASRHHAKIQWQDGYWSIQDISRNGTSRNGVPLTTGKVYRLEVGDLLRFSSETEQWTVRDTAPPRDLLIPIVGGPCVVIPQLLPLPSDREPEATIFRDAAGFLHLERGGETQRLDRDGELHVGSEHFRVQLAGTTTRAEGFCSVADLALTFQVAPNGEDISVDFVMPRRTETVCDRAFFELLLRLAQERQRDADGGVSEEECGWLDVDVLCDELRFEPGPPRKTSKGRNGSAEGENQRSREQAPLEKMNRGLLNRHVYLLRQLAAELDIRDAAKVIERRKNRLRIGVDRLSLTSST